MPRGIYTRAVRPLTEHRDVGPVGRALTQAMNVRGMTCDRLAEVAAVSVSTIIDTRRGESVPHHSTVVRLADALSWPSLIDRSVKQKLSACSVCARATVGGGNRKRLYCSDRCKDVAVTRRRNASRAFDGAIAKHRLTEHQTAVAAYCWGCEPEGLCRTVACPLRSVSPLPLRTA